MVTQRRISSIIGLALACIASLPAHAASFTYDVNYFGMTGNIVASCDTCPLSSSDVTSWALEGNGLAFSSSASDAQLTIIGSELQATPNAVTFAFTPSNYPDQAVFFGNGESFDLVTFPTFDSDAGLDIGQVAACSIGTLLSGACSAQGQTGTQIIAKSAPTRVPELDLRALVSSLSLLFGAMAVIFGRRPARSTAH
jgi:hypothetical protein